MRRFWKEVSTRQSAWGIGIRLDERPVKTPMRNELLLPTTALAEAVVAEWRAVDEQIDPMAMPITGFANAAIDHVAQNRGTFADQIAAYGESDALCYRADPEDALSARQNTVWDPWIAWAERRYGIRFTRVAGVMHQPQPSETLATLHAVVAARGTFELAAMAKLAHLSGSLIAVLALVEQAGAAETLWDACCLDEIWQEELWGSDYWAEKNRSDRKKEFMQAARFLELLRAA